MKLEQIGFYTLTEERCAHASSCSPLSRCEIVLSARCNFKCPYCRHVGGRDMSYEQVCRTHDTKADPICSKNCLDVCVQYNDTFARREM